MNCTCLITYCLEGLRERTVTSEGKNLLQLINRLLLIYKYIIIYILSG